MKANRSEVFHWLIIVTSFVVLAVLLLVFGNDIVKRDVGVVFVILAGVGFILGCLRIIQILCIVPKSSNDLSVQKTKLPASE